MPKLFCKKLEDDIKFIVSHTIHLPYIHLGKKPMQNNQYYAKPEIHKEKLYFLNVFHVKYFFFSLYLGNCKYVNLGNQFDNNNRIQKLSF